MLDYCIDNKLEFSVKSKPLTDEFEVIMTFDDLKKAIAFGVFVKENRIEIPGVFETQKSSNTKKPNGKVDEIAPVAESKPAEPETEVKDELEAELALEGTSGQDMFQSNANSLGI